MTLNKSITVFAILFISFSLFGQNNKELYVAFDQHIGLENSVLNKGVLYTGNYRILNDKHQFFSTTEFQPVDLKYNGQYYYNVMLKYDLFLDELVCSVANSKISSFIINKNEVEEFVVQDKLFVNTDHLNLSSGKAVSGFVETVESSKGMLLVKYSKTKKERIKGSAVFTTFHENHTFYYLIDGVVYDFNSKSDIKSLFPDKQVLINDLYKTNKDLEKQDKVSFIKKIANQLN